MEIIIGETKGNARTGCDHRQHTPPRFDPVVARYWSVDQVRKDAPRYQGICGACGAQIILYASLEHMVAGGWNQQETVT